MVCAPNARIVVNPCNEAFKCENTGLRATTLYDLEMKNSNILVGGDILTFRLNDYDSFFFHEILTLTRRETLKYKPSLGNSFVDLLMPSSRLIPLEVVK